MQLFEEEKNVVADIYAVKQHEVGKEAPAERRYGTALPRYELIYFMEGDNITHFAGKVIHDMPDSVRYLPKGVFAGEYRVEIARPDRCIDVYFDMATPMPAEALGFSDMGALREKFEMIYTIWHSKEPGYYTRAMRCLYEIIDLFRKRTQTYLPRARETQLARAHAYLVAHYRDRRFDYAALPRAAGLSGYSYFKKLFLAKYKMPPSAYVNKLRMEYAKEALITGLYSVTEIAEACGFENVYYFSRKFKETVGVPPTRYAAQPQKSE